MQIVLKVLDSDVDMNYSTNLRLTADFELFKWSVFSYFNDESSLTAKKIAIFGRKPLNMLLNLSGCTARA